MKQHFGAARWVLLGVLAVGSTAEGGKKRSEVDTRPVLPTLIPAPDSPSGPAYCSGEYAEDLSSLSPKVREFDRQPAGQYTYCVRSTVTYECVSYGADGSLRKARRKAVVHGTAFAFKQVNGETLLITNHHVTEWPSVTDEDHTAGEVPAGCKRVSDNIKIVDNESDAYERDDVPLSHVVSDPQLDVAILKAHVELPTMPWKIGHSAALRERNVVDVRGFPLGAFKATNVGKVVSAYDHDDFKDWDHDDFVIDALLSPGNSGSPVLAVSCKTGEFELVGVYHAGYTGGSALNVVVGIDQVRDMMTTLKRVPREHNDAAAVLDAKARAKLLEGVPPYVEPFFPFGSLPALVRGRPDGTLVFEVLNRDFPIKAYPILILEDLPSSEADGFGSLARIWFGNRQGLKSYARADLDSDTQAQISRMLEALRKDAVTAVAYRAAARGANATRDDFDRTSRLERAVRRASSARQDLSQIAIDLADRLAPHGQEMGQGIADAFTPAPGPPATIGAQPSGTSKAPAPAAAQAPTATSAPRAPKQGSPGTVADTRAEGR